MMHSSQSLAALTDFLMRLKNSGHVHLMMLQILWSPNIEIQMTYIELRTSWQLKSIFMMKYIYCTRLELLGYQEVLSLVK